MFNYIQCSIIKIAKVSNKIWEFLLFADWKLNCQKIWIFYSQYLLIELFFREHNILKQRQIYRFIFDKDLFYDVWIMCSHYNLICLCLICKYDSSCIKIGLNRYAYAWNIKLFLICANVTIKNCCKDVVSTRRRCLTISGSSLWRQVYLWDRIIDVKTSVKGVIYTIVKSVATL